MILASLNIKTAFDVARPKVIAEVSEEIGVKGDLIAAMLPEMQWSRGSADVDAWHAVFKYSKCALHQRNLT